MGGSLPSLMRFREMHADDERFGIVAFHDNSVASIAELADILRDKKIIDRRWGGKELSLPILFDGSKQTLTRLQIHAFPTSLLIDPEGRVRRGGLVELAAALDLSLPGERANETERASDRDSKGQ